MLLNNGIDADEPEDWLSDYVQKPENFDAIVMRDGRTYDLKNLNLKIKENDSKEQLESQSDEDNNFKACGSGY